MDFNTRSLTREDLSLASKPRKGFTLLEIIIVVGLIATIAGMAIVGFDRIFGSGQEQIVDTFVNQGIDPALMAYRLNMGRYPSTEEGLAALMAAPSGATGKWKGPYIEEEAIDPWGNAYQYRYPGTKNTTKYDIWSLGPDGVESTDDIGNWN